MSEEEGRNIRARLLQTTSYRFFHGSKAVKKRGSIQYNLSPIAYQNRWNSWKLFLTSLEGNSRRDFSLSLDPWIRINLKRPTWTRKPPSFFFLFLLHCKQRNMLIEEPQECFKENLSLSKRESFPRFTFMQLKNLFLTKIYTARDLIIIFSYVC